jgi:hypothetical protein
MKERVHKVGHAMQPAVEARTTQHARHQPALKQKGASVLNVAAEVAGGDKRRGDDLGIAQLGSHVPGVPVGLEQIVNDAINYRGVIDHRSPPTFVWRRSGGDFLCFSKNWQYTN